ncbi:hypothetical protein Nepgr_033573 [Nepenthes gracilis]|uniref:Uncharacterized protein n=1 Tax=Nepenthes gracilis TaxID=150966 RepID=A0AAD3TMA8_NEPGR|nr:hypothetical protein Nepgr_033573 [Nepenthes gracilis]
MGLVVCWLYVGLAWSWLAAAGAKAADACRLIVMQRWGAELGVLLCLFIAVVALQQFAWVAREYDPVLAVPNGVLLFCRLQMAWVMAFVDRAHPQCLPALNSKSNLSILQPHTAAGQQDQSEKQHHGLSNMQIHHSNSPAIAASSEVSWGELKHAELQHQFNSIQINRASEPGPQHPGHSTSAPTSNSRQNSKDSSIRDSNANTISTSTRIQ